MTCRCRVYKQVVLSLVCLLLAACGKEPDEQVEIVIKDHQFHPSHLEIKAATRVALVVKNQDDSAEEFESFELKREKIIPAHSEAKIIIGPLKAGVYKFFGEFHEKTAQGEIVVK